MGLAKVTPLAVRLHRTTPCMITPLLGGGQGLTAARHHKVCCTNGFRRGDYQGEKPPPLQHDLVMQALWSFFLIGCGPNGGLQSAPRGRLSRRERGRSGGRELRSGSPMHGVSPEPGPRSSPSPEPERQCTLLEFAESSPRFEHFSLTSACEAQN